MADQIKFIGTIHSSLKTIEECPLQESEDAPEADLLIFQEFEEGIKNIKVGSEILLLTWLHKADRSVIKCVPRREYSAPAIGVFSTRSPNRPNPIGIHSVKVLSISPDRVLRVSGLEVLDQTPLIDIKPDLKK
jgi:tRNA-Thr(GGU) m(6)t(6)A37 methyltransferase TsaA